jgi:hypothetical protein
MPRGSFVFSLKVNEVLVVERTILIGAAIGRTILWPIPKSQFLSTAKPASASIGNTNQNNYGRSQVGHESVSVTGHALFRSSFP